MMQPAIARRPRATKNTSSRFRHPYASESVVLSTPPGTVHPLSKFITASVLMKVRMRFLFAVA
jgi:hypothetical protein